MRDDRVCDNSNQLEGKIRPAALGFIIIAAIIYIEFKEERKNAYRSSYSYYFISCWGFNPAFTTLIKLYCRYLSDHFGCYRLRSFALSH